MSNSIQPAHTPTIGEGFLNPIGFHDPTPVFSWRLPDGARRQTAYRIEVNAGEPQWDSGWMESDQSTFVPYGGVPFRSRQQVEWRVRIRDDEGQDLGWSAPARFEMGLLRAEDWTARWIRPDAEPDAQREPVAWLRCGFVVAGKVLRARVHVTARGLFVLHLNGRRVGRDHFAPGWTNYHKRLDVLTYDVTDHLHEGGNAIEAMLGTGWYAGRLTWENRKRGFYGAQPELLLQLEIAFEDGSTQVVASDGGWEGTCDGPIISSSLYDGEDYDARKTVTGWKPVRVNAALGSAQLAPKPLPPVREAELLPALHITEPEPGRFVFDLGQNMVGWARVKCPMLKDHTLTVRYAEMLNADGMLYTANYRSARSVDTYASAETGTIEWEPHFTFHGFRYVELSGLPPDAKPAPDWVTGVVLHSDLRKIGAFASSHEKLNRLQGNIVWGQRGNFLDIPTDCPQRDERLGWTGDAQVFCPTAMFNYDCHAFWRSWLASMSDEQYPDGRIPQVIPDVLPGWPGDSPGWLDAAVFIPWEVYVRTGDTRILSENFAMMERLVGWYHSQSVDGLLPKIQGFGDWLQPHSKTLAPAGSWMGDRCGDTPPSLLGLAFFARSARILADAARVLGRDDAQRRAGEADVVKRSFRIHYFDAAGKLQNAPETQTAYALALAFDLIPTELKSKAAANLARLVREADGHLRTGFLGTPHLARALDENGYSDLACELLFRETYPSWFYPINQGATTMWERWNSYSHEHGFGDVSMNSFNHYAYGAIGQWLYERIAGLAPDPAHPGYKHFFVRPLPVAPLDWARAELETPYGRASCGWKRRGASIEIELVVPPNTTATIEFPDQRPSADFAAGSYRYDV